MNYIPLTYDRAFVSIFGDPENIIITERLVSILLGIDINDIRNNIQIIIRNIRMQNYLSKQSQIDLLLDYKGEKINIELQRFYAEDLKERNLVYASKIHGNQLHKGESYKDIKSFLQIILNDDKKHMNDDFIEKIELYDKEHERYYSNKFKIMLVNLPNYNKSCYNKDEEIKKLAKVFLATNFEEFKNSLEGITMTKEEKELLENKVEEFSDDLDEWQIYSTRSKEELEYEAVMEERLNEATEQGLERGLKQGINQGKKEIVKKSLEQGIDINTISIITGLSISEIENIKTES